MARIIAAYIADGLSRHARKAADERPSPTPERVAEWQRLYCLFAMLDGYYADAERPRFLLVTDHLPPVIDGMHLDFHLGKLGVEIMRVAHHWQPAHKVEAGSFFVFDTLEILAPLVAPEDHILVFSARAMAVQPLEAIFAKLDDTDLVLVEESLGEVPDDQIRARRERISGLRRAIHAPLAANAILAASRDFFGLTGRRIAPLLRHLKRLFPLVLADALRGEDHLQSAAELLGALFALEGGHVSTMPELTDYAAAMPEDFSVTRMSDIPVIIPGYGKEPDIARLFALALPDIAHENQRIDPVSLLAELAPPPRASGVKAAPHRLPVLPFGLVRPRPLRIGVPS